MARGSRISVYGLYSWDPLIFNSITIPSNLSKETLINNILMECAELEVLYPDPGFMKEAISNWSKARYHAWSEMAKVLFTEYDPFINIKRDEVRTITENRDLTGTGTTTGKVSAWNDRGFTDRAKDDSTSTQKGTVTTTETFHVEGDSAITDAQDVLRKEMDVRLEYDLYRIIIDEFKQRFCLLVY